LTIKKVFVTGATGFIGRHLIQLLADEGYYVGILVRSPASFSNGGGMKNVTSFIGDVRHYDDLKTAFSAFKPDAVIHLVTYYAVMHRADEIGVMLDTNVKGTINLLEAAKESGTVRLFVNTSTCAVYKQKKQHLTEDDAIKPQNLYAVTKLQAEAACSFYAEMFNLPCVTLRLFPPYGPGDKDRRLLPYVIGCLQKKIPPNLTTGKQEWDFVYISDIVSAFLKALRASPFMEMHEIINIGTGEPLSVRFVVEKIKKDMGSDTDLLWGSVEHRVNEVWNNSADISKAQKILDWSPQIGIGDGLKKTVEWFSDYFRKQP
jgi:nucleoside-diphosphate-sugar epimerase